MDTTISQSEKNYECQFCKRSFTKEKTLTAHVCEPKRRHQQRDEKHVQIAYIAYKRFYELTQGSSNFKTYEHFAQSQYYNAFVKFGNHIININVINPDYFIDYVIKANKIYNNEKYKLEIPYYHKFYNNYILRHRRSVSTFLYMITKYYNMLHLIIILYHQAIYLSIMKYLAL